MGTDFLYARPTFSGGMAAVMDICGILVGEYNRSPAPRHADFRALCSDWAITGMDFKEAMERFDIDNNVKKK